MAYEAIDYMDFVKKNMEIVLDKAAILAKDGEVAPIAFIIRNNPNIMSPNDPPFEIGLLPVQDGMSKDMFAQAISIFVKQLGATGYIFLCEAWMTTDPEAAKKMENESLAEMDVPKTEVVFASYSGIGGGIMAKRDVLENRELGPIVFMGEGGKSEGRFVDLGFDEDQDDSEYN